MPGGPHDVFLSYRRSRRAQVRPVVEALRAVGVSVFVDEDDIPVFAGITRKLQEALAGSRLLLAWYSADYPDSRPCQWELTTAWLAAQAAGAPRDRVLVVNPEPGANHIQPVQLRDARFALPAQVEALVDAVQARLAEVAEPLGSHGRLDRPASFGVTLTGSQRFVGRLPWLWQVHGQLSGGESLVITGQRGDHTQVRGMGGIGKSLLAEEYAARFAGAWPAGVAWLRARGHEAAHAAAGDDADPVEQSDRRLSEALRLLASEAGIDLSQLRTRSMQEELAALRGILGRWLDQRCQDHGPFLWVVDDLAADLPREVRERWLAPSSRARTLLTTRSRQYDDWVGSIDLGVLDDDEAWTLLTRERSPDNAEDTARQVLALLGNHALAVDVAGASLRWQDYDALLAGLQAPSADALELAGQLAGELPNGHEASVVTTLLASIAKLDEPARDVLRLAAMLAEAPIPVALLVGVFEKLGGDAALALRSIDAVFRASLLDRVEGEDSVVVHALVRRVVASHLAEEPRVTPLRQAAVFEVATQLNDRLMDIREHDALAELIPHAETLGSAPATPNEVELSVRLGIHAAVRGDAATAERFQRVAYTSYKRLLGPGHGHTLATLANLAVTLDIQGDHQAARALYEEALAAQVDALGPNDPRTLRTLHNLASTVAALGDLERALELAEDVHKRRVAVLGLDHPETLGTLGTVGSLKGRLLDHQGALDCKKEVLERTTQALGPGHPETLAAMQNLANALVDLEHLSEARTLFEDSIEQMRDTLGPDHPDTLTAINNLAGLDRRQRDLHRAVERYQQALTGRAHVLGPRHPSTCVTRHNLILTLRDLGDHTTAKLHVTELLWLLTADDANLSADQRRVRTAVTAWAAQYNLTP